MGGGHSCAELLGDVKALVPGKAPDTPNQGGQVFAIDILHGKEMLAIHLADIMHTAYVRM
jgi:hypothetical protein